MTSGGEETEVVVAECRSAVSRSGLPGLDWALNPYRGCAHGCRYCYAQDVTRFRMDVPWGQVVEVKVNVVSQLKKSLVRGAMGVYGVGTATDPYQPLEEEYELTRGCLSLLKRSGAEASILTKSDLVCRDLDLLRGWNGAEVGLSMCTADDVAASILEPGAPSPARRLAALAELSGAGINTYVMMAPIVLGVCDSKDGLTRLLDQLGNSGIRRIIWDVFNPKPMALSRLRKALDAAGKPLAGIHSDDDRRSLQEFLSRESSERNIRLESAF